MTAASYDIPRKESLIERHGLDLPAWAWFGACVFMLVLIGGNIALMDADTYWQIAVGQSILDTHTWPHVDSYSFTKAGEPWLSSSWLSQVIFALAYSVAGWAGPVILTALAVAFTFAFAVHILSKHVAAIHAVIVGMIGALASVGHFLARPHILVLPVMLAWGYGLVSASDRGRAPSLWLVLLIVLWANLHGSFLFGVMLTAPFAFDAVWNAQADERRAVALRWTVFAAASVAACFATPYGWESVAAARRILSLGAALDYIGEWQPVNFAKPNLFALAMLACVAGAFLRGVKLTLPRILLVTGLLFMALSHVRSVEICVLLAPLVLAKPLSEQWRLKAAPQPRPSWAAAGVLVAALAAATATYAAVHPFTPPAMNTPAAALQVLKDRGARRIFHSAGFGGYLITQHVPVFVDGRAELYGETFIVDMYRAQRLRSIDTLLKILDGDRIDATMLAPSTPAIELLDRLDGWQRIYADDVAVIHVRKPGEPSMRDRVK